MKDGRGADADLCRGDVDRVPGVRGAVVCNEDPSVAQLLSFALAGIERDAFSGTQPRNAAPRAYSAGPAARVKTPHTSRLEAELSSFWRNHDTLLRWRRSHVDSPLLVSIEGREFGGFASKVSALKAFIVVNRRTRKIVAEFGTREEAEAFRDGLISTQANGKGDLSIRSTLRDSTDEEAGAAQRAEKRRRTAHPLRRKQRRRPRRTGP